MSGLEHLWNAGRALRTQDARHFQILALATLFCLSRLRSDFDGGLVPLAAAACGTLMVQVIGDYLRREPVQWKSALITAFSLSILLNAAHWWLWVVAGALAIAAKHLVRVNGKHLFNPACIGIVLVTLATGSAWISPGLWGTTGWLAALLIGLAALVLSSAKRLDIALAFLGTYGALLVGRALWLGDPLVIPMHQIQSGALLIFTFFMITDPRSTPDARIGRVLFAVAVAGLAFWMKVGPNVEGAPLYALALLAPLTPLFDRLLPKARFVWRPTPIPSLNPERSTP